MYSKLMQNLENKTIWITGASSGIGEALAIELSHKGAKLILTSRNKTELKRVRSICKSPEKHIVLPMDLEKYHDVEKQVEEGLRIHGPIDVLINNAGLSQRYLGVESTLALDEKIMNVNFFGSIAFTRPILKDMVKNKSGFIAVVSSVLGLYGVQSRTAYSASKHALRGYFESLRNELFETGVKILMIYPGYITTQVSVNALSADGGTYGKVDPGHQHGITAKDCAESIVKAIEKENSEIVIAGPKEGLGVVLNRYAPSVLRWLAPRMKA